jgi:hypothetical protein
MIGGLGKFLISLTPGFSRLAVMDETTKYRFKGLFTLAVLAK